MCKSRIRLFFIALLFLLFTWLTGCTQNQNDFGKETRNNKIPIKQNINWDIKISLEKMPSGTKPVFEINIPENIAEEKMNLRILYQIPIQDPTVLIVGEIGEFSRSFNDFKEQVSLSGVKYNLGTYNVYLKSGVNVFAIDLGNKGLPNKYFSIRRIVEKPKIIPIQYFEDITGKYNTEEVLKITKPNSGLVKGNSPLIINFEGEITKEAIGDNMFKLVIGRQTNEGLREYKKIKLPVRNRKISTSFKLEEPGTYYVKINSPEYFPTPQGGGSISWAEFIAEVN